ncbi:MAG: response regulator transcription factor [Candidatus Planktophila sp.]
MRNEDERDVDIAVKLIEQFPTNVHFIAIRRDEIPEIYSTCASRGPIKVISSSDLRFTEEEIETYASNAGLVLTTESRKIIRGANGWPSATSLLRAHLQSKNPHGDLMSLISSESEPLRALALIVTKNLEPKVINLSRRLSVLENFTLEIAQEVLGKDYSFELIHAIAQKGEIFTEARSPQGGYVFSPMVRQVFLENLRSSPTEKLKIHQRLISYFEREGSPSLAIDHAFEAGDTRKISQLFPDAARIKQAKGQGGDLLRWAKFAGDTSPEGELKKSTVRAAGYLAELDFGSLYSEISKIKLLASQSQSPDFYQQFAEGATAFGGLTLGKFQEVEISVSASRAGSRDCYLGVDDQINLLRVLATKRYIWNESDGVEEVFEKSQELGTKTSLYTSHVFLVSIQAMHLHQRGEYRRAYEVANVALEQHHKYGFVANHGPLDAMFVIARCLFEFARPQEALVILDQIRNLSSQWKQWHWYLTADKHIIEFLSYNNNQQEGLIRIKNSRDFISTIDVENHLSEFIDINEMAVRRRLLDFNRLEKLVNRAPKIRDTQQYKMAVDEHFGRKSLNEEAKKLSEKTPRDLIWKHLMDVSLHVDAEHIALPAMRKALQVGAEVGARETFLRQRDEMANYIIKVANDFPTVYNEELATAMAVRIRERGAAMTSAQRALTKREQEILRQLSTGRTLTVIAAELHISQNTMKTHLKNLYKKLGAEGRHDAVEKAKATFRI